MRECRKIIVSVLSDPTWPHNGKSNATFDISELVSSDTVPAYYNQHPELKSGILGPKVCIYCG
jgi:hypothetical protein